MQRKQRRSDLAFYTTVTAFLLVELACFLAPDFMQQFLVFLPK